LQLTASERPLFARWKDAKLNIAHRHADDCGQHVAQRDGKTQRNGQERGDRMRANPADRMAREEDRLKERLADLQTERPALEAFYNALSPAQKMQLGHDSMEARGRDGMMMRHHMFADAMGPRGRMEGPMGERPMGPPPPDAPPPER
jgi:LTXXQ motif family protein